MYGFADAGCTQLVALGSWCGAPRYAIDDGLRSLRREPTAGTRVYAIGAPAASKRIYVKSGGSCVASTSANDVFGLGAEILPGEFAMVTKVER